MSVVLIKNYDDDDDDDLPNVDKARSLQRTIELLLSNAVQKRTFKLIVYFGQFVLFYLDFSVLHCTLSCLH